MRVTAWCVRGAGAALALCVTASPAWAQAPRPPAFRPDMSVGLVYDDNVFRRAGTPTRDLILRVSPGFELKHDSRRLTVSTHYRFDAERYEDHPSLSTALARQTSGIAFTARPASRVAFTLRAGYQRTQNAQDLNQTTGLVAARQRATRQDASGDLQYAVRPGTGVSVAYDYGLDNIVDGVGSQAHSARVRVSELVGNRTEMSATYRFERRQFRPGPLAITNLALVGVSHRLTSVLSLTFEGGPRQSNGEWRPEVTAALARRLGALGTFALSYTHTEGIAVGVTGLVAVDSVATSVALRRTNRWEVILAGSGFRNVVLGSRVMVYALSGSVGRSLGRSIWLVGSVNTSLNDNSVAGTTVFGERIRRNAVALSLRVAPWSSPR